MFSQLVPLTLGGSPLSLFPATPASKSWKILSGHGRLPTKDRAFHTHVIILFTQYRSSSPPPSPRKKYALPIHLGTVYPTPTHCNRDHGQETSAEPTKASRLSRLICCCSCLRRGSSHSSVRKIPQTFIIFFFSFPVTPYDRDSRWWGYDPSRSRRKVYICSVSHERSLLIERSRSRWTGMCDPRNRSTSRVSFGVPFSVPFRAFRSYHHLFRNTLTFIRCIANNRLQNIVTIIDH